MITDLERVQIGVVLEPTNEMPFSIPTFYKSNC
jgi:hypothetical protein